VGSLQSANQPQGQNTRERQLLYSGILFCIACYRADSTPVCRCIPSHAFMWIVSVARFWWATLNLRCLICTTLWGRGRRLERTDATHTQCVVDVNYDATLVALVECWPSTSRIKLRLRRVLHQAQTRKTLEPVTTSYVPASSHIGVS
jgi:hypothetical protein